TFGTPIHGGVSGKMKAGAVVEIHKQQSRRRVDGQITEAVEEIVPGKVWPPQVLWCHTDESGGAAAMRRVVAGGGMGGAQEERIGRFDEANIAGPQGVSLIQPHRLVGS